MGVAEERPSSRGASGKRKGGTVELPLVDASRSFRGDNFGNSAVSNFGVGKACNGIHKDLAGTSERILQVRQRVQALIASRSGRPELMQAFGGSSSSTIKRPGTGDSAGSADDWAVPPRMTKSPQAPSWLTRDALSIKPGSFRGTDEGVNLSKMMASVSMPALTPPGGQKGKTGSKEKLSTVSFTEALLSAHGVVAPRGKTSDKPLEEAQPLPAQDDPHKDIPLLRTVRGRICPGAAMDSLFPEMDTPREGGPGEEETVLDITQMPEEEEDPEAWASLDPASLSQQGTFEERHPFITDREAANATAKRSAEEEEAAKRRDEEERAAEEAKREELEKAEEERRVAEEKRVAEENRLAEEASEAFKQAELAERKAYEEKVERQLDKIAEKERLANLKEDEPVLVTGNMDDMCATLNKDKAKAVKEPKAAKEPTPPPPSPAAPAGAEEKPAHGATFSESRAKQVFRSLAHDGDLRLEDLVTSLYRIGYRTPNDAWATEIGQTLAEGRAFLDAADFAKFLEEYDSRFQALMREQFDLSDPEGSGYVGVDGVAALLRFRGVSPVPGLPEDLMREALGEAPDPLRVDVAKYLAIHDLIHDRSGFSLAEVEKLRLVFNKFDRDKAGEAGGAELKHCFAWMGHGMRPGLLEELLKETDHDGDGTVQFEEFLRILRKHREGEMRTLRGALAAAGERQVKWNDASGVAELVATFEELGVCLMNPGCVKEAALECGLLTAEELLPEQAYQVLEVVRGHEGFLQSEFEELRQVFAQRSEEGVAGEEAYSPNTRAKGLLAGAGLMNSVRWLGYPVTLESIQDALGDFDLEQDGLISEGEFLKVVRQYRDEQRSSIRKAFKDYDRDKDGVLPSADARLVLLGLGYVASTERVRKLLERYPNKLDVWKFTELVDSLRVERRDLWRKNQGFTEPEMRKLTRQFQKHDPEKTGLIKKGNLAKFIEELFPNIRTDSGTHKRAKAILEEVDENNDEELNFDEFLSMMRIVQDDRHSIIIQAEREAIQAAGFSHAEVKEFRKLFEVFDSDQSGDLSWTEITGMLKELVPFTEKASKELQAALVAVDTDGDRVLQFPEYLAFMRKLMDDNWADINGRSASKVEQDGAAA